MAITDAPTVVIDGTTLAASWSTTRRIALAGLAITWGRTSHLERAKPAQLKIAVLDTDGHMASAVHLTGKPIEITRADGRVIYRGRIDDYDVEHVWAIDPANDVRRRVWRLVLSSACKLAELAQAVFPGPYNEEAGVQYLGPNYWAVQRPGQRLAEVMAAGAGSIVAGIDWADPYPTGDGYPFVSYHGFAEGINALELIERVYATVPLAYANHRPVDNRIEIGTPARCAGLRLNWTGTRLRLTLPAGQVIPARTIAMPAGYVAHTGINEAIDVVQVISPRPRDVAGIDTIDVAVEHPTAHNGQAGGRREHRVTNDVWFSIEVPPEDHTLFQWPFSLDYVSDEYGPRPGIGDGFHDGIDFSGGPAILGADIHAAAAGTVVASRTHPDFGYNVTIDHGTDPNGDRLETFYCHLQSPGVPPGTAVKARDVIGALGNTGLSTGPHLHYETLVNGTAVDPRDFMADRETAPPAPTMPEGVWQKALAADTAALLNEINGKIALPRIRLDWRNFDYAPAVAETFIDTYAKRVPLYFPASVFNVVADAATAHQVIGGTLVYHDGWTLDATLAPTVGASQGITIDQLVTRDEPTLNDFDPDITIADLGNVTLGAGA